jgi:hypothetical protein
VIFFIDFPFICVLNFFSFRATFWFTNQDYRLLQMISQLLHISEGLPYLDFTIKYCGVVLNYLSAVVTYPYSFKYSSVSLIITSHAQMLDRLNIHTWCLYPVESMVFVHRRCACGKAYLCSEDLMSHKWSAHTRHCFIKTSSMCHHEDDISI